MQLPVDRTLLKHINTMERIVIVGYKPFPGKELELTNLAKTHWEILHRENLVSDRQPIIAKASDGTVIEVFGWKSKDAIEAAHANKAVQNLWKQYAEVCEYIPISTVDECQHLFSEFTPMK